LFRILENLLDLEPLINDIRNYEKKKAFKDAFENLVERLYLDSAIRAMDFETIIQVMQFTKFNSSGAYSS